MSDARRSEEPHDRLTGIVSAMSRAMETHPDYQEGDKCVIFMDSDVEGRGGLVMFGYDDDREAIASILQHLMAIFEANGMRLDLITAEKPIAEG